MKLTAVPLSAERFAPYGDVLVVPPPGGRNYFDAALSSLRPGARPSISLAHKRDIATLPLTATQMERHEFSSQSFIPIEAGRWIVMVAPHAAAGGPDVARAEAFVVGPGQGVTYGVNVWHHPLTILDRPASFAIFMWLEKSKTDEEFVTLPAPVTIGLG
jgi:ureidoglycolate lyase